MSGEGKKGELQKEAEERSHKVQRICDHVVTGNPGRGWRKLRVWPDFPPVMSSMPRTVRGMCWVLS